MRSRQLGESDDLTATSDQVGSDTSDPLQPDPLMPPEPMLE